MKPQIRVTASAQVDLLDIWLYASATSTASADQLIDEITAVCEDLANFPEMGRSRDELFPGYRSFPIGRHLIFYRPIANGIEVIRVIHGARNLSELF
jgi:toxin ParE1/3/4